MLAALLGVGALTAKDDKEGEGRVPPVDLERVARRVEAVRGLRFRELPPTRVVTAAQAREEGLAQLDAEYPPARREADTTVLETLGLLPPGSDLRELAGTIFGEEVAGYYDHRRDRMSVVADAFGDDGDMGELILAHELTHALEDQRFGLDVDTRLDDASAAAVALVEGTATVAMFDYAIAHLPALGAADRRAMLGALGAGGLLGNPALPPYLQRSLMFPYVSGARFVDAIGTWGAANRVLRRARPVSSEQILHPGKYRAGERPLAVRLGGGPGRGWRRAGVGTVGEFDTSELVRSSDSAVRAERAAAGWGGGRYALWRRGRASALALAWRWDSARDAAEFVAALPRYVEKTLRGRRSGPGLWRTPRGAHVTVAPGATVRLAIAPSARLSRRLARQAPAGAPRTRIRG